MTGARGAEADREGGPCAGGARDILDNLLEGCQVVGFDWRYVYVNDAVVRHGRKSKEELLGRTMMEVYPGIENTEMFALLRRCMKERTHHEMENEFTFPDGSKGWFDLRFAPVPEGVFIHSLEITERKRAEARIAHLNSVLWGIRNVNQLITRGERDRDRLIQEACELLVRSRGFLSAVIGLTGEPDSRVTSYAGAGRKFADLSGSLQRGEAPRCAREAMAKRGVTVVVDPERSCAECPALGEPVGGRESLATGLELNGRIYGFLLACVPRGMGTDPEEQDLLHEVAGDLAFALHGMSVEAQLDRSQTVLAEREEELRQSQKLEAIGQLAGGVAHDYNNILTVQIGYCELMQAQLRPEDPLFKELTKIKDCAERAAVLTRQLLAFSRKQALEFEVLDLNAVVGSLEEMLRRLIGEDVEFTVVAGGKLGRVRADRGQMEQVIMNLVVNARDAMPGGGKLTIETADVALDEEYVKRHVDATAGPHVMMAINDSGHGMDKETKGRIFEPFFTTKEHGKGTGLGLATVYGIVRQCGGNIWVYSEPGKGTSFKIYLPRVESAVTVSMTARDAPTVAARGMGELILVVEDEEPLRGLFVMMLEGLGYRVKAAANGGEALIAIEEEGLRPDLLITDMVMPGMSGRTLAGRLSGVQPGLKVLFTSGYTDSTIVRHGGLDPETAFLQKPFNLKSLAAKVQKLLAERN